MQNSFHGKSNFLVGSKQTLFLRLFILLILIWLARGFFPILNIEGDSSLFSAGCERLWRNGIALPPDYFYEWDMQPMAGMFVVGVKSVLPNFSSEQIYSVLTILASIAYLFISSVFVSKITRIRWEYCFLIIILFPESYSIAFYPNTTILASLLSLLGFLLILNKPFNFYSLFLLGIAPLFRVDVLAIYPVVFFLLWLSFDFKKSLLLTSLYATGVIIISSIGFILLKANPLETFKSYQSLSVKSYNSFDIASFFKINATFYTIPILILMVHGVISLFKLKNYKLLALTFIPIAILYFIYKDFSGAAPKHIQYIIPFAAIFCTASYKQIKHQIAENKYIFVSIFGFLLLIQNVIGFRFYPATKPWLAKTYSSLNPRPTLNTLASFNYHNYGVIEIVVGSGQIIPTADEFMLISGNLFAPFYWHDVKKNELQERNVLKHIISEGGDTLFIMTTQASDWLLSQQLHNLGFGIQANHQPILQTDSSYTLSYKNGSKIIEVFRVNVERNSDSFNIGFSAIHHRPLYIMALWDWQMYLINERKTLAEPISSQISVIRL